MSAESIELMGGYVDDSENRPRLQIDSNQTSVGMAAVVFAVRLEIVYWWSNVPDPRTSLSGRLIYFVLSSALVGAVM